MGNENTRWSVASDVLPMFPTLVWKVELEAQLREAIAVQTLAALGRMRRDLPPLGEGQGWQSVQSLQELDDFRDLVSCVHRVVPGILRFLRISYDAYQVTACWATVLARGAAHKMHQHPNNFLSGVYYVRTHPGADTINFHDPRNQTGIIRPPVVELTAENTDQVVVRVKDGTMLVFPAYLQHSVDASTSDQERISISFNVMFSSFTENLTKPLWRAAAAPTRAGAQLSSANGDRHQALAPLPQRCLRAAVANGRFRESCESGATAWCWPAAAIAGEQSGSSLAPALGSPDETTPC